MYVIDSEVDCMLTGIFIGKQQFGVAHAVFGVFSPPLFRPECRL